MTSGALRIAGGMVLVAAAWSASSLAQTADKVEVQYPTRPIRLVVAYPPGAGVDLMARAVGQKLSESLGQPVVVENRPGANGLIGAEAAAKAAPDGHTLLVIDRGALTVNPSLYRSLPYDPLKDFAYLGVGTELRYVLAVNVGLHASTLRELVALAKSKPGEINYASFGTGSIIQLNFEQLNRQLDIKLTHIPYKGAAQAATAVVTGEASVMMSSVTGVVGFLRDGRLRALAVGAPARMPALPDVPTMAEVGGGDDTLVPTYFTFAAPAGTPRGIVMKLNVEIARILALPDVAERLQKAGLEPQVSSPEEFASSVKRDIVRFGKLVSELQIPPL